MKNISIFGYSDPALVNDMQTPPAPSQEWGIFILSQKMCTVLECMQNIFSILFN